MKVIGACKFVFRWMCLLLLVLSVTFWVRSWSYSDLITIEREGEFLSWLSIHGESNWFLITVTTYVDAGGEFDWWIVNKLEKTNYIEDTFSDGEFSCRLAKKEFSYTDFSVMGFRLAIIPTARGKFICMQVPYWLPTVIFGLMAVLFWKPVVKRRIWKKAGRCLKCGYQLVGVREKCPECGNDVGFKD